MSSSGVVPGAAVQSVVGHAGVVSLTDVASALDANRVTPEMFGGSPAASAATNGAALQAALNAGTTLFLSGQYQCDRTLTVTGKRVNIVGDVTQSSGIVFNDVDGIVIDNTAVATADQTCAIANIGLFVTSNNLRTALTLKGQRFIVDRVDIRGVVSTLTCWATNVLLQQTGRVAIVNSYLTGRDNTNNLSTYGIRIINQSRDVKITDCAIENCVTAISVEGDGTTNPLTGSEGVAVIANHIVSCVNGVVVSPTNMGNYVDVSHNHLNTSTIGVNLGNADYSQCAHNFFLPTDNITGHTLDTYYAVVVSSADAVIVGNVVIAQSNTRTYNGVRVYLNPAQPVGQNGPVRALVALNYFDRITQGVTVEASATAARVLDNAGTVWGGAIMTAGQVLADAGAGTFYRTLANGTELATNATKLSLGDLTVTRPAAGNHVLEIGRQDGVASSPSIDLHSGAVAVDYDARLLSTGGDGTLGGSTLQVFANQLQMRAQRTNQTALDVMAAAGTTALMQTWRISGGATVAQVNNDGGIAPGTPTGIGGYLRSGTGVPAVGLGNNGDVYFRTDTPGTANQRIYVKSAGAWVGIL